MNQTKKGNLYIFLAAFLWSLGGILLKYVSYGPIATNGLRCLFAYLVFCIYKKSFKMKINPLIFLAAMALTMTNFLFVASNKYTTAANAIVLQYTAPIWVLIWNSLYQKRKPKLVEVFTMLLAFSGTVLFFFDGLSYEHFLGNIMALAAGLCFSGVLFLNFLPEASSEDSSMLAFLLSFLVAIPWMKEIYATPSFVSLFFVLIIGIFQVGLAYVAFSKGSRLTTPVTASLIGLLEAIMNPFWVLIFYGEKVGRFALFGAMLILLAVGIQILSSSNDNSEIENTES